MSTRIGLGGDCNVLHGRAHREQSIPRSSARPSEARLRRAKRGPAERSEARAVNRALRARIRRKLEAVKQEATQLPRLNSLGRRESVLSTYGIQESALNSSREGGWVPAQVPARVPAQLRPFFRSIKPRLFALSQVVATFSLDKTNTFRIVTGGRHLFAR